MMGHLHPAAICLCHKFKCCKLLKNQKLLKVFGKLRILKTVNLFDTDLLNNMGVKLQHSKLGSFFLNAEIMDEAFKRLS